MTLNEMNLGKTTHGFLVLHCTRWQDTVKAYTRSRFLMGGMPCLEVINNYSEVYV